MFKEIVTGFSKFFTRDKVIIFIALLILGYALFSYSDSKMMIVDRMEDGSSKQPSMNATSAQYVVPPPPANLPPSAMAPAAAAPNVAGPGNYAQQPVANPSDLLPKDTNSQWAALNPVAMNQGNVVMPDLLQAGYHIGLDTIGQTLRNANLQLRSDPIITKQNVGPWMQSTIEPDLGRVPLEVGVGCQ
jgi:hypothetical protein